MVRNVVTVRASSTSRASGISHRDLLGAGGWVVLSFIILSGTNYAFSLVLSRLLSVADYGSFGVLSSILLLAGLVSTAGFPWMLSSSVARHPGPEHAAYRTSLLATAGLGNLLLGIVTGTAVGFAAARLIPGHAAIPWLAGAAVCAIFINAVWLGLYQGERRFPLLSGLRSGEAVSKALIGVALVVGGFGLEGAVGGAVAGAMLAAVWGATRVRNLERPRTGGFLERAILPSVGWIALAQLGLALLMNLDILAVRALGTGAEGTVGAGYYQAAIVLARAPVFVGIALLNAIFPFLAKAYGEIEAERRLMRTTLRVIALAPLPVAVLLAAAPGPAIHFFFPASYAPAIPLLRLTAASGIPLIVLAAAIIPMQATQAMRAAAAAVVPAVAVEVVLLVVLVPRMGADGAAWSSLVATTVGAILVWIGGARRWTLAMIVPSPVVVVALTALAGVAVVVPMPGRTWPLVSAVLGAGFLLFLWLMRGVSATEIMPLVPQALRPALEWIASHEPRKRP